MLYKVFARNECNLRSRTTFVSIAFALIKVSNRGICQVILIYFVSSIKVVAALITRCNCKVTITQAIIIELVAIRS